MTDLAIWIFGKVPANENINKKNNKWNVKDWCSGRRWYQLFKRMYVQVSPVPMIEVSSPPRTPTEPSPPTPRPESRRKNSVTFDLPPMKSDEESCWTQQQQQQKKCASANTPMITVTAESDDNDSEHHATPSKQLFKGCKRGATSFLTPFGGATPRTISESNLSSSGYSSMASPSSSRSGSVKTICEPESPNSHKGLHQVQTFIYRMVPMKPIITAVDEIPMEDLSKRNVITIFIFQ